MPGKYHLSNAQPMAAQPPARHRLMRELFCRSAKKLQHDEGRFLWPGTLVPNRT
jgi:hypothetical protein